MNVKEIMEIGGAGTVVGTAFTFLKSVPFKLFVKAKSQFVNSLTVETCPFTEPLEYWLSKNKPTNLKNLLITYSEHGTPTSSFESNAHSSSLQTQEVYYRVIPNNNTLLIYKFNNVKILVSCSKKDSREGNAVYKTYTLTFLTKNKSIINEFVREVDTLFKEYRKNRPSCYSFNSREVSWNNKTEVMQRPLNSVFLPKKDKDALLAYIDKFVNLKEFYRKVSVPYRTGLLFYGVPGSGKTSFASALAMHLNWNFYNMTGISHLHIEDAYRWVQENSIVLIEDVDTFIGNSLKNTQNVNFSEVSNDETAAKYKNKFSDPETLRKECLAVWLNCIDGIHSKQNIITIMTTNHIDSLDSALIRAGRIDFRLHFDYARKEEIREAYFHFYGKKNEEDFLSFYEKFDGKNVVMAEVQNALLDEVRLDTKPIKLTQSIT